MSLEPRAPSLDLVAHVSSLQSFRDTEGAALGQPVYDACGLGAVANVQALRE
jgi:hypothetical protein